MKAINIYFEDSDYDKIILRKKALERLEIKNKLSWRDFILKLVEDTA